MHKLHKGKCISCSSRHKTSMTQDLHKDPLFLSLCSYPSIPIPKSLSLHPYSLSLYSYHFITLHLSLYPYPFITILITLYFYPYPLIPFIHLSLSLNSYIFILSLSIYPDHKPPQRRVDILQKKR